MTRQLRLVQFMGTVGLLSWLSVGCSGDEGPAPGPTADLAPAASANDAASGAEASEPRGPRAPACTDMQLRECRVELGVQGSVRNCFVGLQLCVQGKWGACQDADDLEAQLSGN